MKVALHCPKDACIMSSSMLLWQTGFLKLEALSLSAVLRVLLRASLLKSEALTWVQLCLRCLAWACEMSCCKDIMPAHMQPLMSLPQQPPCVQHQRLTC